MEREKWFEIESFVSEKWTGDGGEKFSTPEEALEQIADWRISRYWRERRPTEWEYRIVEVMSSRRPLVVAPKVPSELKLIQAFLEKELLTRNEAGLPTTHPYMYEVLAAARAVNRLISNSKKVAK